MVFSNSDGLGYILLNGDNPTLNAPGKFLGDQRQSYGLTFEVTLMTSNNAVLLPQGSNRVWLVTVWTVNETDCFKKYFNTFIPYTQVARIPVSRSTRWDIFFPLC